MPEHTALWAAAGAAFGLAAWRLRLLTPGGAAAGGAFGACLLAFGGAAWAAPAVVFFALSSLLSRIGRRRKAPLERRFSKGATRDAGQVLANGGAAWALLLGYAFYPSYLWYAGFLGALAAAAADTWGTELGVLAPGSPRHILTGAPVPPGASGGVSLWGTLAGAAGALAVGLAGASASAPMGPAWLPAACTVVAGAAGSIADSVLGATLQARYADASGRPTERAAGPGGPHRLVGGRAWLTNDGVNAACTLVGAAVGAGLAAWMR